MIAVADLVEAETGAMRRALARTAWGIGVIAASWLLLLGGVGLWLWSAYLYLGELMAPAPAAAVTGLASLMAAGALVWLGFRMMR